MSVPNRRVTWISCETLFDGSNGTNVWTGHVSFLSDRSCESAGWRFRSFTDTFQYKLSCKACHVLSRRTSLSPKISRELCFKIDLSLSDSAAGWAQVGKL